MKDVSSVVERLRESKQQAMSEEYNQGLKAGREWAESTAEYTELRRLGEMKEGMSPVEWESWFGANVSVWQDLFWAIHPEQAGSRGEAESFWEMAVGDNVELTSDFVRGFGDGAVHVWQEVKDKL